MSRYLLDTNHLSPLVTPNHPLRKKFFRHQHIDEFAFCTPSLTEFLFGIGIIRRSRQNLDNWYLLRGAFDVYELDESVATEAADLQIMLRKKGWKLNTIDAQIATIALLNKLILLTTDRDFSAVPHLTTENWLP